MIKNRNRDVRAPATHVTYYMMIELQSCVMFITTTRHVFKLLRAPCAIYKMILSLLYDVKTHL